jgi:hypothetical protein
MGIESFAEPEFSVPERLQEKNAGQKRLAVKIKSMKLRMVIF